MSDMELDLDNTQSQLTINVRELDTPDDAQRRFVERIRDAGNVCRVDGDSADDTVWYHVVQDGSSCLAHKKTTEDIARIPLIEGDVALETTKTDRDGNEQTSKMAPPDTRRWTETFLLGLDKYVHLIPPVNFVHNLPAMRFHPDNPNRLIPALPGLDPSSNILYVGKPLPPSTLQNVDPGYPLLRKVFSDMRFVHESYMTNATVLLTAGLVRHLCPVFPHIMVDATQRNVGKTSTAKALSFMYRSNPTIATLDEKARPGELTKTLAGSTGLPGPCVFLFDNVVVKSSGRIGGSTLALIATTNKPSLRGLYDRTAQPLLNPVIIFTMNEGAVDHDMHDRVFRVFIDGEPFRYFDPEPHSFVQENRHGLLLEAQHLLQSVDLSTYFPPDGRYLSRMGIFERIMGAVAVYLDLPTPCFDVGFHDTLDSETRQLFYLAINTAQDLNQKCPPNPVPFIEMAKHLLPRKTEYEDLSFRKVSRNHVKVAKEIRRAFEKVLSSRTKTYIDGYPVEFTIEPDKLRRPGVRLPDILLYDDDESPKQGKEALCFPG